MSFSESELEFFRDLDNLVKLVVLDDNGKEGDSDSLSLSILHSKTRKINNLIERLTAPTTTPTAAKGNWVWNFYIYSKVIKNGAPNFGRNYLFFRRLRRFIQGNNPNSTTSTTTNVTTSSPSSSSSTTATNTPTNSTQTNTSNTASTNLVGSNNGSNNDTTTNTTTNTTSISSSSSSPVTSARKTGSEKSLSSSAFNMIQGKLSFTLRRPAALEAYLRLHEFDPANMKIGTLVDLAKIRYHIHASGAPAPGKVVIVRKHIGGFDWCLFARVVSVPSAGAAGFVVATIDPLEKVCFEVATQDLIFFNNDILNDDDEEEYYGVVGEDCGSVLDMSVTGVIEAKLQERLRLYAVDNFHACGILRHGPPKALCGNDGGSKVNSPRADKCCGKYDDDKSVDKCDKINDECYDKYDKFEDTFEQEGLFEENVIIWYIIRNGDDSGAGGSSKGLYKCFLNIPKIERITAQIDTLLRGGDTAEFAKGLSAFYAGEVIPALRKALPYVFPTYRDGPSVTYSCGPSSVVESALDVPKFIAKSLISMKDRCNKILTLLKVQYNEVIEGLAKKTITEDYLTLIREEVNSYLTREGFDHNAVPEDYVVQPPKDLEIVKKNAEICRAIITGGENNVNIIHI